MKLNLKKIDIYLELDEETHNKLVEIARENNSLPHAIFVELMKYGLSFYERSKKISNTSKKCGPRGPYKGKKRYSKGYIPKGDR